MSELSHCRPALVTDDATPAGAWTRDERAQALHMRAPLTWSGVREYPQIQINGRAARILRRPEQILRPGYLKTVERITPTLGHPRGPDGQSILINPENYKTFAVGSVGDKIDTEVIDGYPVPVGNVTVNDAKAIASIESGNDQVSQGFFALIAPPPESERRVSGEEMIGIWQGPHGPEEYDLEHICDPSHPTAVQYEKENPGFPRRKIGANHLAVGIPKGRGLLQAQARPIEAFDQAPESGGAILFLDSCPPEREIPKMKTKITWSPKVPKGFTGAVPCLDEMEMAAEDSPELMEFLTGLQEFLAGMIEKMAGMEETAQTAQGEAAVAQEAAQAAQTAQAEAVQAADELREKVTALESEVAPLRAEAVKSAKLVAAKVAPGVGLDSAEDLAAIQRAAVVARIPALADSPDATIAGAWSALVAGLDTVDADPEPSPGFMAGGGATPNKPKSRAAKMFGADKD